MKKAFSLIELSVVILIIGILIAGVTQGSRLVTQIKLSSARSQSQSSPVNSIKDLTLWFDATSEKAFDDADAEDAHSVSNWYSINPHSSNKTTVSQATTNNKPFYYATKFNGLPSVYYDGSNDCLYGTVMPRDVVQAKQVTLFIVQNFTGVSASETTSAIWMAVTASSSTRLNLHIPSTGGTYGTVSFDAGNGDRTSYVLPAATTLVKPLVVSAFRKDVTGEIRFNGGAAVATDSTLSSEMPSAASVLGIGCLDPGVSSSYSFHGYIGEIIVYDRALKVEERQAVEQYLGKKWGINVS